MSLSIVHSSAKIDVDALAVTLQRTSDAPHLSHFNSGCHRFLWSVSIEFEREIAK